MHQNGGPSVHLEWPDDTEWPNVGYGNTFSINHTPWDFTLRIGHATVPTVSETDQPSPTVQIAISPVCQVTLPPTAMVQLLNAIQEQVAHYARDYGGIPGSAES